MSSTTKIIKALQVLDQPGAIRELLRWRGFSLTSFQLNAALAKYRAIFHTIFDIGANQGQFALAAAHRFPMSQIYSFEPVPDVFQKLADNVKRRTQIHSRNCAVGNTNGQIKFYRNKFTQVSSALTIHKNNNHPNYAQNETQIIEVQLCRLDDLISQFEIRSPVLLKMDAQGYEKEILRGAQELLRRVDYIMFEASFVNLYDDQPLFDEMHTYTKGLGYELVAPLDFHVGKDSLVIETDVLYKSSRLNGGTSQQ